jgi:hypothetical protein
MRTGFSETDLKELQRQLLSWRKSQFQRTRLPEEIWNSAAELARTQGVSYVARALRLDYYRLKRQVAQGPEKSSPITPPPTFVELQLTPGERDGVACRIELTDVGGAKMSVHFPGDSTTIVALAEAFWRRER